MFDEADESLFNCVLTNGNHCGLTSLVDRAHNTTWKQTCITKTS